METQTHVRIRPAGKEDYAGICYLLEQVDWMHIEWYPEYFQPAAPNPTRPESFIQAFINNADADVLLAIDEAGLVGLCMVEVERPGSLAIQRGRAHVNVDVLVVEYNHRGKGIGRALMEAAKDWAENRTIFEVQLQVYDANEAALAFYEGEGFEPLRHTYRLRW